MLEGALRAPYGKVAREGLRIEISSLLNLPIGKRRSTWRPAEGR